VLFIRSRLLPTPESRVVMAVFLSYLVIYCLHYRSRYFVLSMEMSDFETFRYANNFFYLIPLFIGLNLRLLVVNCYPKYDLRKLTWPFIVVLAVSIFPSQTIRAALQPEEFNTRILPLLTADRLIRAIDDSDLDPVLVTDIPVVGKMLYENEFSVFVQEYQVGHDYYQYGDSRPIYFLLPRQAAADHLATDAPVAVIPMGIDTHYVLYRLPENGVAINALQ
jgi:hypothetical protein